MEEWKVEKLREEFNHSYGTVRVIAVLSPTCPECLRGHGRVKYLFRKFDTKKLRGFVVWLPMRRADNARSAEKQSEKWKSLRVLEGWDGNCQIGKVLAKTLQLQDTAWDVYLVYNRGVRWKGNKPPIPTFWMHQLKKRSGAAPNLRLNGGRISKEVFRLLKTG